MRGTEGELGLPCYQAGHAPIQKPECFVYAIHHLMLIIKHGKKTHGTYCTLAVFRFGLNSPIERFLYTLLSTLST